jgi:hypothetical protein
MKIWLLRIDSIGGMERYTNTAYVDKETADIAAESKREEWISYIPEEHDGEEIAGDRIIVHVETEKGAIKRPVVFALNRLVGVEAVRENAMHKLNAREREVLGL